MNFPLWLNPRLVFGQRQSRRGLTLLGLALLAAAPAGLAASAETSAEVLSAMERVADWQLAHPCAIDIHWKGANQNRIEHARFGWDGTLLRQRTLPAGAKESGRVPEAWQTMARLNRGHVAFSELPAAVQSAWRALAKADASVITGVLLQDEGAAVGWEMATLYHGMLALARVSGNPAYRQALRQVGEATEWAPGRRVYHADDLCVGYLALDFYAAERKPEMIAPIQARCDWLMRHPARQSMDIRDGQNRWTWCDALFMAPPVWLKLATLTGDRAYLEHMDREWWATTDKLYSKGDRLFYRDAKFFDRREKNGQPVFWSRGNAWVVASLAILLEEMPADWPARPRYEQLFRELCERIASLRPADGLWRSSLLDPEASPNPEASSSAFFIFAFARGVRLKLLDPVRFQPLALGSWQALQRCVRADGHLGFVQQPGAAPGSAAADSTVAYGVGAYLLAGSELAISHQ